MGTEIFQNEVLLWYCGAVFDSLCLLALLGVLWFILRKRLSPQWGIALFGLVILKAVVPITVPIHENIARYMPSRQIERATPKKLAPIPSVAESPGIAEKTETASAPHALIPMPEIHDIDHRKEEIDSTPENTYDKPDYEFVSAVSSPALAEAETAIATPEVAEPIPELIDVPENTAMLFDNDAVSPAAVIEADTHSTVNFSAEKTVIAVWLFVASILLIRELRREIRFRKSFRTARPMSFDELPFDLNELNRSLGMRAVPIYELPGLSSPAVYGIFRPVILLPEHLIRTTSHEELRWILCHEMAHIRRLDSLFMPLIRVVSLLFFFNPAVWISRRMIDRLREFACDDFATYYSNVSSVEASEAFMKILRCTHQKQNAQNQKIETPALAVLDARRSTFQRMQRLLDSDRTLHVRFGFLSCFLWLLLAAALLPRLVASGKAPQTEASSNVQTAVTEFEAFYGTITDPQGKPTPGAVVELIFSEREQAVVPEVVSDENGNYRFPLTREELLFFRFPTIRASATVSGEKTIGHADLSHYDHYSNLFELTQTPLNIELRPVRRTEILVRNEKGEPVSGAKVEALVDFERRFDAPFAGPDTDAEGRSWVEIPDNISIRDVWTMKPGLGLDYLHNTIPPQQAGLDLREGRYSLADRLPEKIEFTLFGAEKYTIKVQDAAQNPVEGAWVGPWIIALPGQTDLLNLSGSKISESVSNQSGVAILDWIPVNRTPGPIEFHCVKDGVRTSERPQLLPGVFERNVTLNVRETTVYGTVTDENGAALPGVLVDSALHHCKTLSDQDGRYELNFKTEMLDPKDVNISLRFRPLLEATDRNLVPASVKVDPLSFTRSTSGKLLGEVDYRFKKGVPVNVKIIVNDGEMSYPQMLRQTKELGSQSAAGPFLFIRRDVPSEDFMPYQVFERFEDDGTVSLVLPPGTFQLSAQIPKVRIDELDKNTTSQRTQRLEIPEDAEKQEQARAEGAFDLEFRCTTIETVDLEFQIVRADAETGVKTPEKNAFLYVSRDYDARFFEWKKVQTDENGKTVIRRSAGAADKAESEPLVYVAVSADGSYSGVGAWENAAKEFKPSSPRSIELHPAVTIKGRFVDPAGKAINEGFISISPRGDNPLLSALFLGRGCDLFNLAPEKDGRFEAKGLIPDLHYDVNFQKYVLECDADSCSSRLVQLGGKDVIVKNAGVYDVGDIICTNLPETQRPEPSEKPVVDLKTGGKVDVAALEADFIAKRIEKAHELSGTVVDSQGNPAAGATIILREFGGEAATDPKYVSAPIKTNEKGEFQISTGPVDEDFYCLAFFVESADGNEKAVVSLKDATQDRWGRLKIQAEKPISISLSPVRETIIAVKDKNGKPLADATICVELGNRLPNFTAGTTDVDGEFSLKLPNQIRVHSVTALKSGEGVDYFTNGNWYSTNLAVLPERVELTFTGAISRQVQLVDEQGRALVGLGLNISDLQISGKTNGVSFLPVVLTDENGIATFDFLPDSNSDSTGGYTPGTTFAILPKAFSYPVSFEIRIPGGKSNANETPRIVLSQCATISGRVLKADGSPVPDLQVKASSSGNFWNSCFTDSEGRYTIRKMPTVFPKEIPNEYRYTVREINAVVVPRGPYTVKPWSGFDVKPGETLVHDLQATEGTLVRAKLIIDDGAMSFAEYKELVKDRPQKDFRMSLDYLHEGEGKTSPFQSVEIVPEKKRLYGMSENLNENGEAIFRLPPGSFQIRPMISGTIVETVDGQKPKNVDYPDHDFTITEPEKEGVERIIECRVRTQQRKTFTLRAVRADDPTVVLSNVEISVYPDDKTVYANTKLKTNENGEATIARSSKPITYLAMDSVRKLGAAREWLEIPEGQTLIEIPMYPLVKAEGTLVDSYGKPFANKDFQCRMNRTIPQFDAEGKQTHRLMINDGVPIPAKTDENGYFVIEGLVRNTEYDIMVAVWNEAKNQSENVIRHFFNTEEKAEIDLKKVR